MSTRNKRRDYDSLVKLLLIGDSGVGKSCLLLRFAEDSFTNSFITTIGIDFKIKKVRIRDANVKLQIWDTAGQERFRTITSAYYRGAMGILLVYDVTDENSFKNIRNWMKNIEQHASVNVVKAIVGNKSDVGGGERVISYEQGKALANEYGISFYETSAKTGDNVEDMFTEFATVVYDAVVSSAASHGDDGSNGRVSIKGGSLSYGRANSTRRSSSNCCS